MSTTRQSLVISSENYQYSPRTKRKKKSKGSQLDTNTLKYAYFTLMKDSAYLCSMLAVTLAATSLLWYETESNMKI